MKIGIVGLGYWGPNLVRNFDRISKVSQLVLCDLKQERVDAMKTAYPRAQLTKNFDDLVSDPEIKAIVISTQPLSTHYLLAKKALEHKKHVFLEKPMTSSVKEAKELIALAKKNRVLLHVDHTFEYSAPVIMVKELIKKGELGKIHSINMSRLNLGIFQRGFNVIWDLCPHDFSILNFWLEKQPRTIFASGTCHINPHIEDDAHIILNYADNLGVHIHVSWLEPQKVRKTTVVGSKKMVVYDDVEPEEKIKIYDKGVSISNVEELKKKQPADFYEAIYEYRHGDVLIPKINFKEPLADECAHFIDCIERGVPTRTPGEAGLKVIKLIEAAHKSLKEKREVKFNAD